MNSSKSFPNHYAKRIKSTVHHKSINPLFKDDSNESDSDQSNQPKSFNQSFNQSTSLTLRPKTPHTLYPKKRCFEQAFIPEVLIPIQLDVEYEELKFKDLFTWNVNEILVSPDSFAQILCLDLGM